MAMQMKDVTSSNLAKIGYDPATKTARVQFRNGSAYDYEGVEQKDFDALEAAPSVGTHFNSQFRARYQGTLVTRSSPADKQDRPGRRQPANAIPAGSPDSARARELAVLEAAVEWNKQLGNAARIDTIDALSKAVDAYVAVKK